MNEPLVIRLFDQVKKELKNYDLELKLHHEITNDQIYSWISSPIKNKVCDVFSKNHIDQKQKDFHIINNGEIMASLSSLDEVYGFLQGYIQRCVDKEDRIECIEKTLNRLCL